MKIESHIKACFVTVRICISARQISVCNLEMNHQYVVLSVGWSVGRQIFFKDFINFENRFIGCYMSGS